MKQAFGNVLWAADQEDMKALEYSRYLHLTKEGCIRLLLSNRGSRVSQSI